MITHLRSYLFFAFIYACYIVINGQNIAKLPYCNEEVKHTELIFVSTLDGLLTALDPSGTVSWAFETGPDPLLRSNIHQLELTNNGQWLRIIPSLSGSLYKFDGITIDPIPISAETLLTSSFRYSDDLVIAGGSEVQTYGVLLNSGQRLYECSLQGCRNITEYSDDLDDIIIIERKTHTVRAVEPRTGAERWNFSVGQHNIKIPYVNCIDPNLKSANLNISVVLPEGLLIASKAEKYSEILWQYKFETPIVAVWKWNGRELVPTNLFNLVVTNGKSSTSTPSIYVGMHNKQLYVHESTAMQNSLQLQHRHNDKHSVIESRSLTQIPWKPVPAAGMNALKEETDDSTALSVLYGSEYVNGNGYYLYTEEKAICENNVTSTIAGQEKSAAMIWNWWKEMCVLTLTTIIIGNVIYNYRLFGFGYRKMSEQESQASSVPVSYDRHTSNSESNDTVFTSRYTTEFEPISCLGKGGFGVVFQAKKKFDECDYAIKRIMVPNRPTARDRMMREVKALAKLDHYNIVRYYNAWLECPPVGWQQQHDQQWLTDISISYLDKSTKESFNRANSSLAINMESSSFSLCEINGVDTNGTRMHDSSIIFANNTSANKSQISTTSNRMSKEQYNSSEDRSNSVSSYSMRPASVYLYIQMQLCSKESLQDWLHNNPDRDHLYALNIFEQIVNAVEYVHCRELIHRDLKPSNIFFSLEGQIKVGDFGLVTSVKEYDGSQADSSSTNLLLKSYTNAVGTQLYMSPEQLKGEQYDHKVDIYSLGIILFELLVSFKTEMERVRVLTNLRKNIYPDDFPSKFYKEHELLNIMLSENPETRPPASELSIRLLSEHTSRIESAR